jgi:hypothetical protein
MRLDREDLEKASVDQRSTMIDAIVEKKGYWKGVKAFFGFIFVDLAMLGIFWNPRAFFRGNDKERRVEARNKQLVEILSTTPQSQRGALVAQITQNGVREKLFRQTDRSKFADTVRDFVRDNLTDLPPAKIADELRSMTPAEATRVLVQVKTNKGYATQLKVFEALVQSGGISDLVPATAATLHPNQCVSAAQIVSANAYANKVSEWKDQTRGDFANNPVIMELNSARDGNAIFEKLKGKVYANTEETQYTQAYGDGSACASSAFVNAGSLDELGWVLKRTGDVVSKQLKAELAIGIKDTSAFKKLTHISTYREQCKTKADYAQAEAALDNFVRDIERPRKETLASFIKTATILEPQASELTRILSDALTDIRENLADAKSACREEANRAINDRYREQLSRLNRERDNLNADINVAEDTRAGLVRDGKSTTSIDERISDLKRRRDQKTGEIRAFERNGPDLIPVPGR